MKTSNTPPTPASPEQDAQTRRSFLRSAGLGATALGLLPMACSTGKQPAQSTAGKQPIQGFERTQEASTAKKWTPVSDRKVRVGIVGYGLCKFGAEFGFQNHPNVEIVAVSDLFPDRCEQLAKACRCSKTYPSLEELVKDDRIEAVFIATDAPSHAKQAILALQHGKHVASAVPAVFGSLEEADQLYEAVKTSGKKYMMFETSCFHEDLYAMRQIYNAGGLGKLVYSEGEYYHYMDDPLPSYKEWRVGLPPQYYPTHSNAYYIGVTGGSFTEVSCLGIPSIVNQLKPANNRYQNPFGSEIALFRTSEGGMSRMAVSWDTPGDHGERGRIRGQKGSFYGRYEGLEKALPDLIRPALPPGVDAGGHGGSHGRLTDEFITAILQDRQPLVDIAMALNLTVSGIVAHQSAMKSGETLKIPQYKILS
ncbi:Gfo/Idh/MocA family protein [Larkinella insperata]|uniref:Gfo/Idh/MocA family protein n=1 Tax=Larkinella insperata TaxID=332158 RepID=A0ABW3QJA0_9BACT|nr:Gfo/Idh/MocA family oxidoreductase [Larkinella insperata]